MKNFLFTFGVLTILCGFWELTSYLFVDYRFILPSFSSVLARIWESSDLLIMHSKATLREMAGGFLLALMASFPLAWVMYNWNFSKIFMQPLFIIIQSIPMFTLAPIMVLLFGWSYMAIVIPTALMIFLPLTMNIYQGLASTPQSLLDYFKMHQATRWQTFAKLQLPWSMPHIFAGLRISAAFAGIGTIAGEWAGAQIGLGVLMLKSRRETDLEMTFAALFFLIFMSMGLYGVIAYAENRYKHHRSLKPFCAVVVFCLLGTVGWISGSNISPTGIHPTRLLLDWFPNSNHVPIYAGMEKGIFSKHHMDLQVLELNDPSDTIPYITSRQADIALFYLPDVIQANTKGAGLKIAGVLIDQPLNSFLFRANEGIISPQDLSGKVIGYCVAGSNFPILERLLKEKKIVPKELRNVNFDLVALLGTGQVDAVYGAFWNIEGEHLKFLNVPTEHFEVSQLGHPHYSELVFVSRENSKEIDAFKLAMQESIDYCKKHPEEAFDLYVRCHPAKSNSTIAWEKQAWLKTLPLLAKSQQIFKEDWDSLKTWLMN